MSVSGGGLGGRVAGLVHAVAPRLDVGRVRRRHVVLERRQPLRLAEVLLPRLDGDGVVAGDVQPVAADGLRLVTASQVVLPRHERDGRKAALRVDVGVELDLAGEAQEAAPARGVRLEVQGDQRLAIQLLELGQAEAVAGRQARGAAPRAARDGPGRTARTTAATSTRTASGKLGGCGGMSCCHGTCADMRGPPPRHPWRRRGVTLASGEAPPRRHSPARRTAARAPQAAWPARTRAGPPLVAECVGKGRHPAGRRPSWPAGRRRLR